jgi:hypothetical protein
MISTLILIIQSFFGAGKETDFQFQQLQCRFPCDGIWELIKASKLRSFIYIYQGFDPATVNFPPNGGMRMEVVNQRDAELFFLWQLVSFSLLNYSSVCLPRKKEF